MKFLSLGLEKLDLSPILLRFLLIELLGLGFEKCAQLHIFILGIVQLRLLALEKFVQFLVLVLRGLLLITDIAFFVLQILTFVGQMARVLEQFCCF